MNKKLTLSIPEDLYKRFRVAATDKFGDEKGRLSEAGIEAITVWLESVEK